MISPKTPSKKKMTSSNTSVISPSNKAKKAIENNKKNKRFLILPRIMQTT